MQLPKPPSTITPPLSDYLLTLTRELEKELRRRPTKQADGVLYLGGDRPVSLISPNGTIYRLSVDDNGDLVTEAQ